jgi:hypothetical protein
VRAIGTMRPVAAQWLPWVAVAWVSVWVTATFLSGTLAGRLGS